MPARVAFEETLLDACRPAHQGQHLDPARNGDHARVEGGVVGDVGGVCVHVRSRPCWSGFSRELLPRLLPLRRHGEVGRGCCRFAAMPTAPLPNPPLPSPRRGRQLAAAAAPTAPSVAALFFVYAHFTRLAPTLPPCLSPQPPAPAFG